MSDWLAKMDYSGRSSSEVLHARLGNAPRGTTDTDVSAYTSTTPAFVALLRALNTKIDALEENIPDPLHLHPGAHVLTSLPRSGNLRAARLLAAIVDAGGS